MIARTSLLDALAHLSGRLRGRVPLWLPLLFVVLAGLAGPALADPDYGDVVLPGLDPILRSTTDPRLLGAERLFLREYLLAQGFDPAKADSQAGPTLSGIVRNRIETNARANTERLVIVTEINGPLGIETVFEYPEYFYLFQNPQILPGGFVYYPPRPVDAPEVGLFLDGVDESRRRRLSVVNVRNRIDKLDIGPGGASAGGRKQLNLTIPIKLPRTLEKIIGRGEKTNISISGRLHISLSGETVRSNKYVGNEFQKQQPWFPTLDMQQQLQVNLSGTIGEKINVEVDHNSQAIGPEATKIRLWFEGDDDEIIKSIETGDVGLTLPGSGLLGYSSSKSGLFGIKVVGQVGRLDFTVVTSKQKAESSAKSFNSKGGTPTTKLIEAGSYVRDRYFRLDIPRWRFGDTVLPDDGVGQDSLGWYVDYPSRPQDYKIDPSTIRVFIQLNAGAAGLNEITNIAAYRDTTGWWWRGDGPPDGVDPDAYNQRWAEVALTNDDLILDETGDLIAVDLGREYLKTDVLAVTYDIVPLDGVGETYRVGGWSEDGSTRVDLDTGAPDSENGYLRLKLLKNTHVMDDPYTFQYSLRNFYSLGSSNIDPESFDLQIQIKSQLNQTPLLYPIRGDTLIPWIRVFGLDRTATTGAAGYDDVVDKHDPVLFDMTRGLLKFPESFIRPFYGSLEEFQSNLTASGDQQSADWLAENWADGDDDQLVKNRQSQIYDSETNPDEFLNYSTFQFVVTTAAASSSFNLGVSNIEEGSEQVIVDGRNLQKDVDYTIDYTFGDIRLIGDAAGMLTGDSQIVVNYQYAPFFGGGQSNLIGFNLDYDIGPNSQVSTTWLYESNEITGYKPKLGEEPARNLVGNLNFQHVFKPYFLTHVANFISLRDSDKESTVRVNGEFAVSIPNSNTMNKVYLEDFEGIDSSDILSVNRTTWWKGSVPEATWTGGADYLPEDRVETIRWFYPRERVLRRYLNPELDDAERDETVAALHVFMRDDDDNYWQEGEWGGVMRGLGRNGIDLSKAQFLEFWFTDFHEDFDERRGKLHIDFGYIGEDFYWKELDDGSLEVGEFDREDTEPYDYVLQGEEDTGLDGVAGTDSPDDQPGGDDGRDDYGTDSGTATNPYPQINGTEGNAGSNTSRLDTEDLDGDSIFDETNGYFSITIDLKNDDALVDVLRDYEGKIPAGERTQHAWRKFRIPLGGDSIEEFGGVTPDLDGVTHARIWYEIDDQLDAPIESPIREFQIADVKFLGSRWERQGIRKIDGEDLIPEEDRGDASFFLGEVNNKENPDYRPPVAPRVEQNIEEKESALVLDFSDIERGQMIRVGKRVSSRGDDYTRFDQLSWWWYNPESSQSDIPVYFRVGADSTSYYEVRFKWDQTAGDRQGWHNVRLNIGELSRLKLLDENPETGNIEAQLQDAEGGDVYDVVIAGRPDLRNVRNFTFGMINDTDRIEAASGRFYLNDVLLQGVHKETGLAQNVGVRLDMANVVKAEFKWSKTDSEFHGLNATTGSGQTSESWSASTNLGVHDFVPLLGYKMPVSLTKSSLSQLPKYAIQSDILLDDPADRERDSTKDDKEGFSVNLNRAPSQNVFLRYLLDPWSLALSGSRNERQTPTSWQKSKRLAGTATFNIRLPSDKATLGAVPLVKKVPVLNSFRLLPGKFTSTANFSSSETFAYQRNVSTGVITPSAPSQTRAGALRGNFEYKPLSITDISLNFRSERDLLRERHRFGLNIGTETQFTQGIRVKFNVPRLNSTSTHWAMKPVRLAMRSINAVRPTVSFDGGFTDGHPVTSTTIANPKLHNLSNSGHWEVRWRFPVGAFFKSILPPPARDPEVEQMIQREQRSGARRGPAREAGGAEGGGEGDDEEGDGEDEELLTAEERLEREQELAREQAEEDAARRREEAEDAGLAVDEPDTAAAGAPASWDAGGGDGGPRLSLSTFTEPVLNVLRNTDPITMSFTTTKKSTYSNLEADAFFWYRVGLAKDLGIDETEYASGSFQDNHAFNMSTNVELSRRMELGVDFKHRRGEQSGTGVATKNYSQDWPDASLSITGLERWRIFGGGGDDGWFSSSNFDVSYKKTRSVNGYTDTQYNPKDAVKINPRWTGNFRNGMTMTLGINLNSDTTHQSGAVTEADQKNFSIHLRHRFKAERLLASLKLYRPGANPTVTMDLDVSYAKNTNQRTNAGASMPNEPTGSNRLSVTPSFTYNITSNLSGSLRIKYSRSTTLQTDVTTSTMGLGIETTFSF